MEMAFYSIKRPSCHQTDGPDVGDVCALDDSGYVCAVGTGMPAMFIPQNEPEIFTRIRG